MFVIQNTFTGEFAGCDFPAATVADCSYARRFATIEQAEAALENAYNQADGWRANVMFFEFDIVSILDAMMAEAA